MRTKKVWCEGIAYGGAEYSVSVDLSVVWDGPHPFTNNYHAARGVKRKRMTCPVCKQRFLSSVYNNSDGDVHHTLPKHKRIAPN